MICSPQGDHDSHCVLVTFAFCTHKQLPSDFTSSACPSETGVVWATTSLNGWERRNQRIFEIITAYYLTFYSLSDTCLNTMQNTRTYPRDFLHPVAFCLLSDVVHVSCRLIFASLLFVLRCFNILDFECSVNIHTIWVKRLSAESAAGLTSYRDYLLWYCWFYWICFFFIFVHCSFSLVIFTDSLNASHKWREMYSTFLKLICTIN